MNAWEWASTMPVWKFVASQALVTTVCFICVLPLERRGAGSIPDMRVLGYSAEELEQLFQAWGPQGRDEYIFVAVADVVLLIPIYTVFFGGILLKAISHFSPTSSSWQSRKSAAYMVLGIAGADVVETLSQIYSCSVYPSTNRFLIDVGRMGNRLKYLLFGLYFVLLFTVLLSSSLFVRSTRSSSSSKKKRTR